MDRALRPLRFETNPNDVNAAKEYQHWIRTFEHYVDVLPSEGLDKYKVLANYLSPQVYDYISEKTTYDDAVAVLQAIYVKPKNEVFARHLLATRRQQNGESIDEFLQALQTLSKDCNFKAVDKATHASESIRDAFITGIQSQNIRQRLLENSTLKLETMYDQARQLDVAQKSSESYVHQPPINAAMKRANDKNNQSASNENCWNCGNRRHPRKDCPARNVECNKCKNKGHFSDYCKKSASINASVHPASGNVPTQTQQQQQQQTQQQQQQPSQQQQQPIQQQLQQLQQLHQQLQQQLQQQQQQPAAPQFPNVNASMHYGSYLAAVPSTPNSLKKAVMEVTVNGCHTMDALVDSGSSDSFIHPDLVNELQLPKYNKNDFGDSGPVMMASTSLSKQVGFVTFINVEIQGRVYENLMLTIMEDLCVNLLLGLDFQRKHESVVFKHGGSLPPLVICNAAGTIDTEPPQLFAYLSNDCKPIAAKSRRYSQDDRAFLQKEKEYLLSNGLIEPSNSPWRAQVLVTGDGVNHRKRMVVDFSQTINQFTYLDAYPLPRIDDTVNKIAQYSVYSTYDLQSAYYQILLNQADKPYTAFELDGGLYQFCVVPNGITNGCPVFQRIMDDIIKKEGLQDTFAYQDNVHICGHNETDHDINLKKFLEAAEKWKITFNDPKTVIKTRSMHTLGYVISKGELKPDPERFRPLRELPVPTTEKQKKRCMGLLSYYSKWISNFSDKIIPLVRSGFPLTKEAEEVFHSLKQEIENSAIGAIDEDKPFVLETDASDNAIAATLSQEGRPVAFFSRTLHGSELGHPAVEKEANAIIEAVRYWRHFLTSKQFTLLTDQEAVSFIFEKKHKGKIKNDKIYRWKLELSSYKYIIKHKPGIENVVPDTLSRAYCNAIDHNLLHGLHCKLCHPGITRMMAYIRSRNFAFSVEEVKKMTNSCVTCNECKPRFFKPETNPLIKSTKAFERLNLDFKGPLPTATRNKYILTVIDEYSRFPFAFPCSEMTTATIIKCLTQLFAIFGYPGFVHSDRGPSFMSKELKDWLHSKGIATSRTTAYNPRGNGQCERYNGIIWRTVCLALKTHNLPIEKWEVVLLDALHSIRTLISTATNETPHDRFFSFERRSAAGSALPDWLSNPGKVLRKRHVRQSKYEPLVEEVDLIEANPSYAYIRSADGRETTVSLRDLAPRGGDVDESSQPVFPSADSEMLSSDDRTFVVGDVSDGPGLAEATTPLALPVPPTPPVLRRSNRIPKPVDRLDL